MPIYEYRAADPDLRCAHCSPGFDQLQKLNEPPLAVCPECGAPVQRVISAPAVHRGCAGVLAEDNLSRHGFTQYRKIGQGVYEKTAGRGPDTIADDGK